MAQNGNRNSQGAPPREIHIERKPVNWLAWLLLLLGILALLYALVRHGRDEPGTATTTNNTVVAQTPTAPQTAANDTAGLGTFLAGSGATPQTFTFGKLNFDTAKSAIRPQDQVDINAVAATLKQYPNARIRIAGYADARGSEPANVALGKARADSVRAALVAKGIAADRIETASGGASDPVDTNATAAGQAQNRRTELVVTQR